MSSDSLYTLFACYLLTKQAFVFLCYSVTAGPGTELAAACLSTSTDVGAYIIKSIVTVCMQSKLPLALLNPWKWPSRPWARLHLDFARPLQGKTILVLIDVHTKWIEPVQWKDEVLSSGPMVFWRRRWGKQQSTCHTTHRMMMQSYTN